MPLKFWQGERKELWLKAEELVNLIRIIQTHSESMMDKVSINLDVSHGYRTNLIHVKLTRRQTACLQAALVEEDIYTGLQELLKLDREKENGTH